MNLKKLISSKKMLFIAIGMIIAMFLTACTQVEVPIDDDEAVFCAQDVMECPDGSFVARDPENNCEFFPCPEAAEDDTELDDEETAAEDEEVADETEAAEDDTELDDEETAEEDEEVADETAEDDETVDDEV